MLHKIIQTDNYLLVVDESEIKEGDCYLSPSGIWFYNHLNPNHNKNCKKVLAHLPLNNSPILEGVPLLPLLEDDETICPYPEEKQNAVDWHNGYNKAREKYKYTEEDLREALFEVLNTSKEECCATHTKDSIVRRVIKSLQQTKYPIGFESEMVSDIPSKEVMGEFDSRPKTTINSQGITQLVGTYIYE